MAILCFLENCDALGLGECLDAWDGDDTVRRSWSISTASCHHEASRYLILPYVSTVASAARSSTKESGGEIIVRREGLLC
jgi:hypothetical protein